MFVVSVPFFNSMNRVFIKVTIYLRNINENFLKLRFLCSLLLVNLFTVKKKKTQGKGGLEIKLFRINLDHLRTLNVHPMPGIRAYLDFAAIERRPPRPRRAYQRNAIAAK